MGLHEGILEDLGNWVNDFGVYSFRFRVLGLVDLVSVAVW